MGYRNRKLVYGDYEYEVIKAESRSGGFMEPTEVVFTCVQNGLISRHRGCRPNTIFFDEFALRNSAAEFDIEKVIYNGPATIVLWKDGTKTVVKCRKGDDFDFEKGLLLCIAKKAYGNTGKFNDVIRKHVPTEIFSNLKEYLMSTFGGKNGNRG